MDDVEHPGQADDTLEDDPRVPRTAITSTTRLAIFGQRNAIQHARFTDLTHLVSSRT